MAITKKARDAAYMGLYRAVAKYVKMKDGRVILCDGIQIQEWPSETKGSFVVGVKCFGRIPRFASDEGKICNP